MTTAHVARYTPAEELANGLIHALGIVLSIVALAVLVGLASVNGNALHVIGVSVFGAALILMYTASTLYHSIAHVQRKEVLRAIDHSCIYLLIAGTYTPFCLVTLQGTWGWSLFAAVWSLAFIGIVLRIAFGRKSSKAAVAVYILMGWLVIVAFKPFLANINTLGLTFMLLGGIAYTGGVVFYVARKLPFHHAIWHVFVLLGSVMHFFAILYGVIPNMAA